MRARDIFLESVGISFALELCVKIVIVITNGESSKGYQLFKITAKMIPTQIATSKDMTTSA